MKYILEINKDYFNKEVFSKKDAFRWLITNSSNGRISYSLRDLGSVWHWHYSAVKRLLDKLHSNNLINIISNGAKTTIVICHYDSLVIDPEMINRDKNQNSNCQEDMTNPKLLSQQDNKSNAEISSFSSSLYNDKVQFPTFTVNCEFNKGTKYYQPTIRKTK